MCIRNKQTNSGITLITLVITIIVLLILAGVTLYLTLGENGLLERTEESKNAYLAGEKNDIDFLNNAYEYMNRYFGEDLQYIGKLTEEERTKLKENGLEEITNSSPLKNEDNVKAVITGDVPIPEGFNYVDGTKETGVIIKNSNDSNEFVWIPTDGLGYTYSRQAYNRNNWGYSQTQKELDSATNSYKIEIDSKPGNYFTEAMPQDELASVNKYKGYYIGRYEAGIIAETARSQADVNEIATASDIESIYGKPLIQANRHTYNLLTQNQAKGIAERLYNKIEDRVTSKLCSSYAWDTMLKFIEIKHGEWITNSTQENTEEIGLGLQKTGYHSVNNIYDIGGNVLEWTTENYSNVTYPCVRRGGYYNASALDTPSAGRDYVGENDTFVEVGFRITLFL